MDYKYTDSFVPDSTLVKKAYYHRGEQLLFVEFVGGAVYGYERVPSYVWNDFVVCDSAGNYYNSNLKYKYSVVTDIDNLVNAFDLPTGDYKFVVVGVSPVEYAVEANSIEDAKADFARLFPNGILKEVRVHFE